MRNVRSIVELHVDREPSIGHIKSDLMSELGVSLLQPVAYQHERNIERQVRTLRNRVRCLLTDCPVPITRILLKKIWEYIVKMSNFIRNKRSSEYLPIQLYHGKEEYFTPPRFGQFIVCKSTHKNDKLSSPREIGMIVGFEEDTKAVEVLFPGAKETVFRDSYREISDELGKDIYHQQTRYNVAEEILVNDDIVELNDLDWINELYKTGAESMIPRESLGEEESQYRVNNDDNNSIILDTVNDPLNLELAEPEDYGGTFGAIYSLVDEATIKGDYGKRATCLLELEKVWKKYKCIEPVPYNEIQDVKKIIKSRLLLKEKTNAENKFVTNKARLVARGDTRVDKPDSIQEIFSPTVSLPTWMILLNITLLREYEYATADFESAYLNSEFQGELFMKLDKNTSELMIELDREAEKFKWEDGCIYVKILKGLYGLQESAKLWYITLERTLKSMNFKKSRYDHACFYRREGKDATIILTYVDDSIHDWTS